MKKCYRCEEIKHISEFGNCINEPDGHNIKCGIEKPIAAFGKNINANPGYFAICKSCVNKKKKEQGRDRSEEYKRYAERMMTDSRYRIRRTLKNIVYT